MMFQNIPTIEDGVAAAFRYFRSTRLKKIATLTSNDQPGNLANQAAQKLHGQYGIDLVTTQVFDPQAQNLAPQAEQISASHPDAVFAWTAGPQLITSLRALFTAGVSVPVMLNYASMVTPLLQRTAGSSPKTLLFFATKAFDPSHITDPTYAARVKDFGTRFQATFHPAARPHRLGCRRRPTDPSPGRSERLVTPGDQVQARVGHQLLRNHVLRLQVQRQ